VLDQPTLKGNIHKRDGMFPFSLGGWSGFADVIWPGSDQGQDLIEGKNKEAQSEGAFNEETGEINWDCPVSSSVPTHLLYSDDSRSSQDSR